MRLAAAYVLAALAALAGCGCDSDARSVPVLGTLRAQYRLDRLPRDGLTALLERPAEGRVCVANWVGHSTIVKFFAIGELADAAAEGGPVTLEPVDVPLLSDAAYAELRVVDADGDGDDDLLIRAGALELVGLPPAGTPWRERVWIASDCSGALRPIVDVSLPMRVPPVFVADAVFPIRAGASALAFVNVTLTPGLFSYVITRELAGRSEPCRELSCLPLLTAGGEQMLGFELTGWERQDGTLALGHVDVRVTGHLQSEWFLARRDCHPEGGVYECGAASDWGLVVKALGHGTLSDEHGEAYLRVSVPDTSVPARVQSWSSPSQSRTHDFYAGMLGWATFQPDGSWRFGSATKDLIVAEQDASGVRVIGRYAVEGWPLPKEGAWPTVLPTNPARAHTLVLLTDTALDHHDIVELPRE